MKNIVALVDFSDLTRKMLDFAAAQALKFESKLILLHAEPESSEKLYKKIDEDERHRRARLLKFEHGDLVGKAQEMESLGIDVQAVIFEGVDVENVLREINKHRPDMVVIGNHHHGVVYNLFNDSLGEDLVDELTCPTVLIS